MTMAAVVRPAMFRTMPAMSRKIQAFEARFTAGTMRAADLHGRVVLGVLAGMAHLVAGRGRGGDGAPVEGLGRERHRVAARVEVVLARAAAEDLHIRDAVIDSIWRAASAPVSCPWSIATWE